MRTTLDLNDNLLTQAKTRAAQEHRTLTSVVEEALRVMLNGTHSKPKKPPEIPVFKGGELLPGVPAIGIEAYLNDLEDREKYGKP